ncbi:unnamed protein product, partial [Adineta steineri]
NMVERTLGAKLPLADMHRLEWVTADQESSQMNANKQTTLTDTNITLNPMQIRTFRVTLA